MRLRAAAAGAAALGLFLAAAGAASSARAVVVPDNPVRAAGTAAAASPVVHWSYRRTTAGAKGVGSASGAYRRDGTGTARTKLEGAGRDSFAYETVFRAEDKHLVVYARGRAPGLPATSAGKWARIDITRITAAQPGTDLSLIYGTPPFINAEIDLLAYANPAGTPVVERSGGEQLKRYSVVIDPAGEAKKAGASAEALESLRANLLSQWGTPTLKATVWLDAKGRLRRISEGQTKVLQGGVVRITTTMDFTGWGEPVRPVFPAAAQVQEATDAVLRGLGGADRSIAVLAQLRAVSLTGAQVGRGYTLGDRPDGLGVIGLVTLDPCGRKAATESLRLARLQVDYGLPGKQGVLSNEIVAYKPGGAAKALAEEKRFATACSAPTATGGTRTEKELRIPGLPAGAFATLLELKEKQGTVRVVGIFQVRGDVLSGVYARVQTTVADATALAVAAARQSAGNLQRAGAALQRAAQQG